MKLHKIIIEDSGVTSANGIAGYATPLLFKHVKRVKKNKETKPAVTTEQSIPSLTESDYHLLRKIVRTIQTEAFTNGSRTTGEAQEGFARILTHLIPLIKLVRLNEGSHISNSSKYNFDTTGVIAKLKGMEKKEKMNMKNTTTFGLDDADGNIVRVTVKDEDAQEFEKALQGFLSNTEEDALEIAEILYKLKDRFVIINVEWPDIEEDEEEAGDELEMDDNNVLDGLNDDTNQSPERSDAVKNNEQTKPDVESDDSDTKSLLLKIINMMQAEAEARKADAVAKATEAKAKEAEEANEMLEKQVRREEELLDMEQEEKAQKEHEKEVKRLAKLALWKKNTNGEETPEEEMLDDLEHKLKKPDDDLDQSTEENNLDIDTENEEVETLNSGVKRRRVSPKDISDLIISTAGMRN